MDPSERGGDAAASARRAEAGAGGEARAAAPPRIVVNGDAGNRCFGCSPHNERGLRMTFVETAAGEAESRYVAPEHLCGAPGVVHGGVQATLLDEAMGIAARAGGEEIDLVTVDFELRYRRPVPTGVPLRVRGRLVRAEGRDHFVEGEILGPDDERLTRATARWRRVDRGARRSATAPVEC